MTSVFLKMPRNSVNRLSGSTMHDDKRRLKLTETDARGHQTSWGYDSNGYLQSVTDRNSHTVSTPHDNLGHAQSTTAADTATVNYYYDTRDWQTAVVDGLGHVALTRYDAAKRLISLVNPLGITTVSTGYDAAGRVTLQTDALNHATQSFYDSVGRLDHTLDPINQQFSHAYDDAGRALSLTNRRSKTFGFGYGSDGLPTTFSYPSGRQSQIIDRDAHGLPKTLQSPSGKQTALTYDAMSRVKTRTDGVGAITWYYDGEGNATDVTEVSGTNSANIHRVYDELGRVTSCTDSQGNTVGYGYDNEGNIASITYPGNKTVTYTYDGSNRIKTVTDWASRVTTYYYDATGRLDHVDRPNSTRQRVTFDDANRLTNSYEEKMSGGSVVATLWQAGYGYDNANRLTSFAPTPMAQNNPPPPATMTFDSDNQLATYNGQSIGHDADGNLSSAPVVSGTQLGALTWDARNRLTSAGGITYAYDAENRRTRSVATGGTTTYIYSRGAKLDRLLVKNNPDGSVTRYIHGAGLLYEETTNAQGVAQSPVYYHYDWRGDTVALSDATGNVTARMSYSPYGVPTVESGTVTTPFCFNGKWGVMTEASGLLSMQARYYSPVLQRFLNEDPSGFNGGVNLYAYASGDPIDLMDPFGLGPVGMGSQIWNAVSSGASTVMNYVTSSMNMQKAVTTFAWNTAARTIGNMEGLVQRNSSGSPIIDGPVSGYLNYVFAPGEPAVIGPNLARSLQNLAQKDPLPITATPTNQYYQLNATSKDNLIVNTTLQNFRFFVQKRGFSVRIREALGDARQRLFLDGAGFENTVAGSGRADGHGGSTGHHHRRVPVRHRMGGPRGGTTGHPRLREPAMAASGHHAV